MSMFEVASRNKIRFNTSSGVLNTEDLWDLSLDRLNTLAKALRKELRNQEEEDFLDAPSQLDEVAKLKFDVVLHILNTKKDEANQRKLAAERKAEKQKMLEIIGRKRDASLENLTEEELQARIAAL